MQWMHMVTVASLVIIAGCADSGGEQSTTSRADIASVDTKATDTELADATAGTDSTDGVDGIDGVDAMEGADAMDGISPDCDLEPTITSLETQYFATSCALAGSCHKGPNPGGIIILDAGTAYSNLIGVESVLAPGKQLVVPGDPEASFLVQKVEGTMADGEGTIMPQGAQDPIDPACRIATLRAWIAAGAPQ